MSNDLLSLKCQTVCSVLIFSIGAQILKCFDTVGWAVYSVEYTACENIAASACRGLFETFDDYRLTKVNLTNPKWLCVVI